MLHRTWLALWKPMVSPQSDEKVCMDFETAVDVLVAGLKAKSCEIQRGLGHLQNPGC